MQEIDTPPLILFGAFDRHNFGDLLLAEIAAAQAQCPVIYAGLAARDMRPFGGHEVMALPALLRDWPAHYAQAPELLHVGGEILTTNAWEAAVMLLDEANAQAAIASYARDIPARNAWSGAQLETSRSLPYVVDAAALPQGSRVRFRAIGGVAFAQLPRALQQEALHALAHAESASVRDPVTQAALAAAGLRLPREPDPALRVRELFAPQIAASARQVEVARLKRQFPQGFLALQFAAENATDATLKALAAELDAFGLPLVAFRAGAAPWHDSSEAYTRLQRFLRLPLRQFESLKVWDICALIASCGLLIATSLHANLVAHAFRRASLRSTHLNYSTKLRAVLSAAEKSGTRGGTY